jgi:hypothetical protein
VQLSPWRAGTKLLLFGFKPAKEDRNG